jgi:branched-chain amino acid transport system permease protein
MACRRPVQRIYGVGIYLLIVHPMQRRGANSIHITFVLFTLTYLLRSLMRMFSFGILKTYGFASGWFALRTYDFEYNGLPGILYVAPITSIVLFVLLHFFLTRTKFGIAIRATAEDHQLASGLGVNTPLAHLDT